jgi:hypothetical protein
MLLTLKEQNSLVSSMKAAFGCSTANIKFYSTVDSAANRKKLKELKKLDAACDKVSRAFFEVCSTKRINTFDQLQSSVAIYFGWFAWIFIKWAAPRILRFLWERTHDVRLDNI